MFRKKAQFKPFANLKSSERKKLFRTVCDRYGINEETLSPDAKTKIMPKDLRSAKIQLHSGDNAVMYSDGEKPVWLSLGSHLIPTLFTMWECPYLLPYLITPELTIDRLENGADLMIPGVFDPLPEHCPKGSIVAVSTLQNPSVPVAVGIAQTDCHNLEDGITGKAALIVSVKGDTLMEGYRGGYTVPKELNHTVPQIEVEESQQSAETETETENQNQNQNQTTSDNAEAVTAVTDQLDKLAVQGSQDDVQDQEEGTSKAEYTAEEVDHMFKRALIQTLRKAVDTPLDLPMPGSTFLSQFVLPNLPISDPNINMKKTSFKKAAKYFKAMEKEKLLKYRERSGEIVIQSVAGMDNEEVKSHTIYKVKKVNGASSKNDDKPDKLIAKEYFKPRSGAQQLFMELGLDARAFYPVEQLRDILKQYIDKKSLGKGKKVQLDEVLRKAFGIKNGGAMDIGRDAMLEALQTNCQVNHKVYKSGDENVKLAKGPIPKISIVVERRGGNKVVTIVSNLEPFHLNPINVGEELRVICAGATSVTPIVEDSDLKEVLVQGPQTKAIVAHLESKGLQSAWINVTDKTKKNKKR